MKFKKSPALTKVLAAEETTTFWESFEMDHKVHDFIAKYKQGTKIEMLPEVGESGEKEAKLKPHFVRELSGTYKLFVGRKLADERMEEAKAALLEETKKYLKKYAGKKAKKFEVQVLEDDDTSYYALKVELKYDGQEETLEPSNLYYNYSSNGEPLMEWAEHGHHGDDDSEENDDSEGTASGEINWAAWFGDNDSPLHSDAFCEAYDFDQMTVAMDQFCGTLDESMYPHDLETVVKNMLVEPEKE
jgi:hypothetical protein